MKINIQNSSYMIGSKHVYYCFQSSDLSLTNIYEDEHAPQYIDLLNSKSKKILLSCVKVLLMSNYVFRFKCKAKLNNKLQRPSPRRSIESGLDRQAD